MGAAERRGAGGAGAAGRGGGGAPPAGRSGVGGAPRPFGPRRGWSCGLPRAGGSVLALDSGSVSRSRPPRRSAGAVSCQGEDNGVVPSLFTSGLCASEAFASELPGEAMAGAKARVLLLVL